MTDQQRELHDLMERLGEGADILGMLDRRYRRFAAGVFVFVALLALTTLASVTVLTYQLGELREDQAKLSEQVRAAP